jgi:ABC-2 type transport system permease protein
MNRTKQKRQSYFELTFFLVAIVAINIIASFLFFRIDFTKEKRFTLAPSSKELVKNLNDVVFITVYLEGEFPASFKRLRNSTKETLDELRAYAGGNIEYEFVDPNADPDPKVREDILAQLGKKGLTAINLQVKDEKGERQQIVVPGATVSYRGREIPFQLLQSQIGLPPEEILNNSVNNLEYQIVSTIKKATTITYPKIAFVTGHGELDTLLTADIIKSLKDYYEVDQLYLPGTAPSDLLKYKTLIIAKPRIAFNEGEKFNIDQFIMNGGRVLWLIENLNADMDSLGAGETFMTSNYNLNLDDQLFRYGARVNADLIQDMNCGAIPVITSNVGGQPQSQLFPWLFYPLFVQNGSHPIVKNLDMIKGEFVNTIDTIDVSGIKKTPLLQTSKYTKVLNAPVRISLNLLNIEPNPEQFNKPNRMAGVLLEGKFTSIYKNRLVPKDSSVKFLEEGKPTRMIIVSDGDMIKNGFSKKDNISFPLGYDRYTKQTFGNKIFILNAIDYLTDDTNLISARAREIKLRLLDKERAKRDKIKWQVFNMIVPIIIIAMFGIYLHYSRKRKYAR